MTPDEVRMLDNRYALLFIQGERPVKDLKYDILKHPSVRMTTDGQADPYIHGEPWDAGSSIELIPKPGDIIFIDWGGDGTRDHVGIVERCDGRTVYTIEGNSGDACRRQAYSIGSKTIFGYGVPKFPENEEETTRPTVVK